MSRHDHPAFYESCCTPFVRLTPSGTVQRFHSFRCAESPNVQIDPKQLPRRAEVASHAITRHDWNTCGIEPCLTCDYVNDHIDDEDAG